MSNSKFEQAESILSMALMKAGRNLTRDLLTQLVYEDFEKMLKGDFGGNLSEDDFPQLIDLLETKYNTTMGVVDSDVPHDEDWYKKKEIDFSYWKDYEKLLVSENWPVNVVGAMSSVTDKVLGLLPDPEQEGTWYRRGLVLGHVQSGKTANYIGVISKAADAGYKFIIVIAGIHNNLRKQTQQRVDMGFVGRDSSTKNTIGVGLISPHRTKPFTLTTSDNDFNKSKVDVGIELKDVNNTFVLVIKKNVSTLRSLYGWLKKLNTTEGYEKIADIPMLMIDDEADNASINTNKPELDPTSTNKELRNILDLFNKRAYVGYTATPFANIFINPDISHDDHGDDLFPKDFIYCLDAPTNYFGSDKIFLDEYKSDEIVRVIEDAHLHLPEKQKKGVEVESLPNSLIEAIQLFLLARAIRNLRGQSDKHCSMLINVNIVMDVQRQIKYLVDNELRTIQRSTKFNCKKPPEQAEKDSVIKDLKNLFNTEYSSCDCEWIEVLPVLGETADLMKSFMVNSQSEDRLDYSEYDRHGESLTAVAIGGLSLSRGLTVEGLTVSYIYRNSKMYDTLLQMGRWFGYRKDYEDLCRIYMTEDSLGWYSHISEATEELRSQLKRMRREGKSPSDFGLHVKAHPDTLTVTAVNKMRHAEMKSLQISYSGSLVESYVLPDDEAVNRRNTQLIEDLFSGLFVKFSPVTDDTNSYCYKNITWEIVQEFLYKYRFHSLMDQEGRVLPDFVKQVSDENPEWDVIFKNPKGKTPGPLCLASQERRIGFEKGTIRPKTPDHESGYYVGGKQRFSGNNMFAIGLNATEIQKAKDEAVEAGRSNPLYSDYTNARSKPVLMLHYLNLVANKRGEPTELIMQSVPAISITFPSSNTLKTVDYVVNPIWLKQLELDRDEWPEDEFDNE